MQKLWVKKRQQAERERQNKAKSEKLAKLRDPQSRRGYRKIHVGTDVYQWKYYGDKVEIRTPSGFKWVVPIWQLQGHKTEADWFKEHEDCCEDCTTAYWVQPKLVREYIDQMRRITA